MKRHVLTISCVALLASCSKPVVLEPTGGSKADGTIEMSYEFGAFDKPIIDPAQATEAARNRCRAWGYADAEPFGGSRSTCERPGGMTGCNQTLVTMKYQCLDKTAVTAP